MTALVQAVRDRFVYASGYMRGRTFALPNSFADFNAQLASKLTTLITLPLPFLSFLALPFFGGSSTTISLVFFYLTWTALVLSHNPLWIEICGTLVVRLLFFVLPALGFLAFDCLAPAASRNIKAKGRRALPLQLLPRQTLIEVTGWAIFNVFFGVAVQALLEVVFTDVLHLRSLLRVTSTVPLPFNLLRHVVFGFAFRGATHYFVHRYLLHTLDSPLQEWHLDWQHGSSMRLPFSLTAAYDHPINYLLAHWLPTFLPALIFRFHVLTWHLFIALASLEELLVHSGYSVLPSAIILAGMARRTDEHYICVHESSSSSTRIGNYGRWGVLDFVFGTTCHDENDVADDLEAEADKHQLQNRLHNATDGVVSGIKDKRAPEPKAKRRNPKKN